MPATPTLETKRERVGTFQSLDGAARALSHLVELRYDPNNVAISPQEFEVAPRIRRRDRLTPAMGRGAAIAAAAGGFVALVRAFGLEALIRVAVLPIVIAAVVGAGVGVLSALAQHRRDVLDVGSSEWLRPTAFDVVVDRESASARHHLAQWWDPAAPPVEGQRAA